MKKEDLINKVFDLMLALPKSEVDKIANFVDFLDAQYAKPNESPFPPFTPFRNKTYDFLNDEEELYSLTDIKEPYSD